MRCVTEIRIGRPPAKPPRKWSLGTLVLAAVAVLVLAGAAATAGIFVARQDKRAAAGAPTPSPAAQAWSEADLCLALLPLLDQGSKEIIAIGKNPKRSTDDLDLVARKMQALEPKAPEKWQADVSNVRQVFDAVVAARGEPLYLAAVNEQLLLDSSLRLTQGCRPYVLA